MRRDQAGETGTRDRTPAWPQGPVVASIVVLAPVLLLCLGLAPPPTAAQAPAAGSSPTPLCAGQAHGAACWTELASQASCYVWNDHLAPDATVTWSGVCAAGFAQGAGSLTWIWGADKRVETSTGLLQDGKPHGPWVFRDVDGKVHEGPYVNGKPHGHWVTRKADGTVGEGPYVNGKPRGHWVWRYANGEVHEGPMVDGKMHGHWVLRLADGNVGEGPMVDGEQDGHWVIRKADGGG